MKVRCLPSSKTLQGAGGIDSATVNTPKLRGSAVRLHELAPSMLCPCRRLASGSASEKKVLVLPSIAQATHGEALQTVSWQLRPPPPATWSQIQRSQSLKIVGALHGQMTRI